MFQPNYSYIYLLLELLVLVPWFILPYDQARRDIWLGCLFCVGPVASSVWVGYAYVILFGFLLTKARRGLFVRLVS